jgi:hypothetical protein
MSWDRVERLIGTENLTRLAGVRVGVVGLGSGGGLVALSLAMSGVGRFVLVDDDILESANIVRHVADISFLGQNKAEAVAELIHRRNPEAQVDLRVGRIEQHMDVLDNVDILVVGVDGENAKYIINQACLERRLTAVYAGVYERGEGGDVVVIHPYDGPCYACWAAELREGLALGKPDPSQGEVELDYGMIGPEGTLEAEPGLWLHVLRVATVQADLALNELLRDTSIYQRMPANTIIMANRELEIIDGQVNQPHTSVWVNIERDPHCLICGDQMQRDSLQASERLEENGSGALSLDELMNTAGLKLDEDVE